jgi:hypothetical protein
MIFSAHQHRTIAQILREKARRAPDPVVKGQLLKMVGNHEAMAVYLDRNPHRGPVPAVTAPSIAPG